jgi:PAS domain-containing protein
MTQTEPVIKKKANDDFLHFVYSASDLLWWKRTETKEIILLTGSNESDESNDRIDTHGIDVKHLLRDLVWAQQRVEEEDFFRFKLFIKSMRNGIKADIVFRLKDKEGRRLWWRITGAPGINDSSYYYGYIHDITGDVAFINQLLEKDLVRQTMIETDENPVLLIDMETKAIISSNSHANQLFAYTHQDFSRIKFPDIYPIDRESQAAKVYEICLLEGWWEGKFTLKKKGDIPIEARIKVKRLTLRNRNLLRVSIEKNSEKDAALLPAREEFEQTLMAAMADKDQISSILDTLLEHQFDGTLVDAVMYVDVYIKKNSVEIYGSGDAFKTLESGTNYDYEGTISQLIRDRQQDYFLLDDTLQSTRPIDWALFIPYGIRSYFVKPFFHGGKLRTLLFFCALEPHRFSETDLNLFEVYYPAFLKGLRNWRKNKREKGAVKDL